MANFPNRPNNAMTGSQFMESNLDAAQQILSGNFPDFMRNLVPVIITENGNTLIYKVTPDYLSVGNNTDYVRAPLNGPESQKIADAFGCVLPTPKMSDQIWKAAKAKLAPEPLSGKATTIKGKTYSVQQMLSGKMADPETFEYHNQLIQNQLNKINHKPGELVAGGKKDVVLSNDLIEGRLAIHGLHDTNGKPIQQGGLSKHNANYKDYGSGTRLVDKQAILNGKTVNIVDVLKNPKYLNLISDAPLSSPGYSYEDKSQNKGILDKIDSYLKSMNV